MDKQRRWPSQRSWRALRWTRTLQVAAMAVLSAGCAHTPQELPLLQTPADAKLTFRAGEVSVPSIERTIPALDLHIGDTVLRFAQTAETRDTHECEDEPAIFVCTKDQVREVRFPYRGHDWIYAGMSLDARYIWALTALYCGDDSDAYELFISRDAGLSWQHVVTLPEPYYMAHFDSFRMDDKGHGALSVFWDDHSVNPNLAPGYYIYETDDWGYSWRGPRFQGDIVSKAHDMHAQDDDSLHYWRETMKARLR